MNTFGTIYGSELKHHSPIRVVVARMPLLNYGSDPILEVLPLEEVPLSCCLMSAVFG